MRICLLFLLLILNVVPVNGQDNVDCKRSTEGSDFWFGFMESRWYSNNHYLEITVTAREQTTFNITIGPNDIPFNTTTLVLFANSSRQIKIPWEDVEALGSETIENKGIHLVSEKPVNVYALNYDSNSADVAVIFPTESLGKEYFAMCYEPNIHENGSGGYGNGRNSEFLIVAVEDSTMVEITPTKVTDQLRPADSMFSIVLNQGQVYQVQSMNFENLTGQGDLTGSFISSSKPVAFYSGSLATTVPVGTSAWDHLYEQIPPIQTWGKEYYTVPLRTRLEDRYRVMAARDGTSVFIEGKAQVQLDKGEYYEFVLTKDQPSKISSDKPIMVVQFSQSRSVDANYTGGDGDPFMIILSPTSQSKNDVTFVAYDSNRITKYFANIITLTEEVPNIYIDSPSQPPHRFTSSFKPFADGEYSYAQLILDPGEYRIYNTNKDRGFLAYVYGFGGVESYGYGVGFNLDLVLDIKESIDLDGDTLLLCQGESRILDAGPYFDDYIWSTGDSTQKLEVFEGGEIKITATTIDGCALSDSIFIDVKNPQTSIGQDTAFCAPATIQLDANPGFTSYEWHSGDTTQTIIANQTADYHVTVYDAFGCSARDTMHLEVYPKPYITLDGPTHFCGERESSITAIISGAPEYLWKDSVTWSTNKPDSLNILQVDNQNVNLSTDYWGEYEIYVNITTSDGCISPQAVDTIGYFEIPTSDFDAVVDPADPCGDYNREIIYLGNATEGANFYWDFSGLHIFDTLGFENYIVSVPPFSTALTITLDVEQNGCESQYTSKDTIGANPDFTITTENSRACDSTIIYFKGELGQEDDLLFEWDFGDGSPISNEIEPVHPYNQVGFYDVGLTITQVQSRCQIGFTIDSMIKVFPTPEAPFSADPDECYPDSVFVTYLNAIDSSICYWEINDILQLDSGPEILVDIEAPTAKVKLTVDEFGCVSEPVTKMVKRKPHFDFTTEFLEGCQPYSLDIIALPFDSFLNFTWFTDEIPYPEGDILSYHLPEFCKFGFELTGISTETGCTDTVLKEDWITVHPKPISNFFVDYEIATIEHATIQFTDSSIYGINYYWDFDDTELSDFQHPTHEYLEIGEYYPQLITETDFGCLDTSQMLIQILPFNLFTPNAFRPDSEIAENRVFMPLGIGADPNRFHLQIFDRWGQLIFETKSFDKKWEGKMKNGKDAPMGNYIWISNFFDVQGYEHSQKGQVILVR